MEFEISQPFIHRSTSFQIPLRPPFRFAISLMFEVVNTLLPLNVSKVTMPLFFHLRILTSFAITFWKGILVCVQEKMCRLAIFPLKLGFL